MADAPTVQGLAAVDELLRKMKIKDEKTDTACNGCGHAAYTDCSEPEYRLMRSSSKVMAEKAEEGCPICPLLLEGVERVVADNKSFRSDEFSLQLTTTGAKTRLVRLLGTVGVVSFYVKKNSPLISGLLPNWPLGYEIPGDTSSDASLVWFKERLEHCEKFHEICNSKSRSPLPKRVLDIGKSHNQGIKLYQSQGETDRYAALSHCWGTRRLLRTLSSNIDSFKNNIPWVEFPRTYQQTITFLRKLNLRYLWIDSMCIIQDDEDDWRREAAKMASIYRGSYLTISAANSPESDSQLFSVAHPNLRKTYRIPFTDPSGQSQEIYARLYLSHIEYRPTYSSNYGQKLPLFGRGWVLQERLLSSRILHFGPEELSWECCEDTACECSGIVTDTSVSLFFCTQPKLYHGLEQWKKLSERNLRTRWYELVKEYSNLDLSHSQDIFPAISGLAKEYNQVRQSPYYAGLWGKSLLMDMFWFASESIAGTWPHRPKKWRAPTWSWASVQGDIGFFTCWELKNSCEVLNVECVPAGPDPTGELVGGEVVLRGLLLPSRLRYRKADYKITPASLYDLEIITSGKRIGNVYADYDPSAQEPESLEIVMTAYCFLIGEITPGDKVGYLLLKCVGEDLELGCRIYERLGLVHAFFPLATDGESAVVKII